MNDETTISFANLSLPQEGVAVVLAEDGPKLSSAAKELDKESKGLLSRAANISGFKGKKESTVDLLAPAGLKFSRLVLMGAGKPADYSAEDWLNLGGTVRGMLTGKEGPTAHIVLDGASKGITPESAVNFALGAALRGYKFKKYKSKPKKNGAAAETTDKTLKKIVIHTADPRAATKLYASARAIASGVTLARDLVNEPANVLGPAEFAARAKELTKLGVEVNVFTPKTLQRLGMNALLAVGQGSARPSHVVVMQWKGAGAKGGDPVVFVGKGVTF
ncbi:MAG TPA: M17 family peptidase N-terminal domain-containing protein, partial [Methyloceanibacter sp.]